MSSKLNILVAFPYCKKPLIDYLATKNKDEYRLIIDSGAFTAWNAGKIITLDNYCKFLDSIQHLQPFNAVQLDVIGDPEKSYENYLTMKKRGYEVMPVFTRGDKIDNLDKLYSHTDYILLGGVAFGKQNKEYVNYILKRNKGRKIHLLGFTNFEFLKHYKPYSCDSSSWSGAARFGALDILNDCEKKIRLKKIDCAKPFDSKIQQYMKAIGLHEEEIKNLSKKEAWVNRGHYNFSENLTELSNLASFINILFFVNWAIKIENRLSTKSYLAIADKWQMVDLFNAKIFLKQRGIIQ
jgi:hypothetical protein